MESINIMINGLPGNMAANVATHALKNHRFNLIPASLTGPEITATEHTLPGMTFRLIRPDQADNEIDAIIAGNSPFVSIDYTHPTAVNANAEFYCRHNLPFVMGTTGGKRQKLTQTVENATISAVIAPNMAKQIVGFQAMMAYAAENFPSLFKGYSVEIKESHQQGKADTSGTAKAMVDYFNALGMPFSVADIEQERDPKPRTRCGASRQNTSMGMAGTHTPSPPAMVRSGLIFRTMSTAGTCTWGERWMRCFFWKNKFRRTPGGEFSA